MRALPLMTKNIAEIVPIRLATGIKIITRRIIMKNSFYRFEE
jgi:hypothetical protein